MENEYRAKNLIDFSYYMDEHLIDFTGREWVFREIQAFLDYSAVNTFILVGDPGIGKTSLSAKFIRSNPSIVTAFHFCSTRRGGWNDPIGFSKSLCTQLSLRYQEFPQMIADLQGISIHIDIHVETLTGGQIIGALIDKIHVSDSNDYFNRLIRDPLHELYKKYPSEKIVIAVDGLDEAIAYRGSMDNIIELLSGTRDFPPNVRFILTTRDETRVLRYWEDTDHFRLYVRYNENLADVSAYIKNRITQTSLSERLMSRGINIDTFANRLKEKSEGNFLYISYLLNAISANTRLTARSLETLKNENIPEKIRYHLKNLENQDFSSPEDVLKMLETAVGDRSVDTYKNVISASMETIDNIDRLEEYLQFPAGIDGIYRVFIDREIGKDIERWHHSFLPVIGILVAAQDELSDEQLLRLSNVDDQTLWYILHLLWQFLSVEKRGKKDYFRLYHRSLCDFLSQKERAKQYWIDAAQVHKKISHHYLCTLQENHHIDSYGLNYLSYHLFHAGMYHDLWELVREPGWVKRKRHVDPSFHAYLNDLDYAIDAAEEGKLENLPILSALSFLYATLKYYTHREIPFEVISTCIQCGDIARALRVIEGIDNIKSQIETYIKAIPFLAQTGQSNIVHDIITSLQVRFRFIKKNDETVYSLKSTYIKKDETVYSFKVQLAQKCYEAGMTDMARSMFVELIRNPMSHGHLNDLIAAEDMLEEMGIFHHLHSRIEEILNFHRDVPEVYTRWHWTDHDGDLESDSAVIMFSSVAAVIRSRHNGLWKDRLLRLLQKLKEALLGSQLLVFKYQTACLRYHAMLFDLAEAENMIHAFSEWERNDRVFHSLENIGTILALNYYSIKNYDRSLYWLTSGWRNCENNSKSRDSYLCREDVKKMADTFFTILFYHAAPPPDPGFDYYFTQFKSDEACRDQFHQLISLIEWTRGIRPIPTDISRLYCKAYLDKLIGRCRQSNDPGEKEKMISMILAMFETNYIFGKSGYNDVTEYLDLRLSIVALLKESHNPETFDSIKQNYLDDLRKWYLQNASVSVEKDNPILSRIAFEFALNDRTSEAMEIVDRIFTTTYDENFLKTWDGFSIMETPHKLNIAYYSNSKRAIDVFLNGEFKKMSYVVENDLYIAFSNQLTHNLFQAIDYIPKVNHNEIQTYMIFSILYRYISMPDPDPGIREDILTSLEHIVAGFWSREDKINAWIGLLVFCERTGDAGHYKYACEHLFQTVDDYISFDREKNILNALVPYLPILVTMQNPRVFLEKIQSMVRFLPPSETDKYVPPLIAVLIDPISMTVKQGNLISYVISILDFARNTGKDFFLQFLIQLVITIKDVDKEIAEGIKNQVTAVQDFLSQLIPT